MAKNLEKLLHEYWSCKRPNTQRAYQRAFENWREFVEDPWNYEPENAVSYLTYLKSQHLSIGTIRAQLHALSSTYGWLVELGCRVINPWPIVLKATPSRYSAEIRPTPTLPYDLGITLASKGNSGPYTKNQDSIRDAGIFACLFGGGMRRSEVRALNVGHVRETPTGHEYLELRAPKAGRAQTQVLAPWAWKFVHKLRRVRIEEGAKADCPLFVYRYRSGKAGKRIGEKFIYRMFVRALDALGIKAAPHAARASAATFLLESGCRDRDVADFLRHRSTHQVQIYDKRSNQSRMAELLKKLSYTRKKKIAA